MSGSVTPARRPRSEAESDREEGEDFDVSVDGDGSVRSSSSKRARLSVGDDEASEGDILPDSFRRSPKNKQRAVNGLTNGHVSGNGQQKHHPGSIVRVTLTDFVTYTKAEFNPGPSLNMIIGPNGTGKSTLVCATCLGLGWATSHLGRAKDLGEFVKHGAKRAIIEIELAADPARQLENPVITTKITKDGNKAEYLIGGKKSNKKGVQELARSFSIQVDNLCQFLPQDRVVEFAALNPIDMLTQTQRAAAPEYMSDWHDELKRLRKDQKDRQSQQQRTMETLKGQEDRQRLQEPDVIRLKVRSGLQDRVAALEKLRPFPAYYEARVKHDEAKARMKEAGKELRQLERSLEPQLQAVKEKDQYKMGVSKVVSTRDSLVKRGESNVADTKKKIDGVQEKIDECTQKIEAERKAVHQTRQSIPKLNQELAKIQRARHNPPEAFDPAAMNEQIREKTRQVRDIDSRLNDMKTDAGSFGEQIRQRNQIIERAEMEKESLHSQAGQQANKLKRASPDAWKAWDWIQKNRDKFQGEIFGPPIVECTVKDPRYAGAVESMIPPGDMSAFTVTSQQDFNMLSKRLYDELKLSDINIRTSMHPLASYNPPVSTEELQRYGLEKWVVDLLDGPEQVLAMLCDNRSIHQTGFTPRDISEQQFATLQQSPISSWVTSSQSYIISRRREYGPQATSTRVNPLRQARCFTDAPVDRQVDQDIDARIREAKGELAEIEETKERLSAQYKEKLDEKKKLIDERKETEDEKAKKQSALSIFSGLEVKERSMKAKIDSAKATIDSYRERVMRIVDDGDKLHLEKGQLALDYANAVEALRGLHTQLFEAQILSIEAASDHEQLEGKHAHETQLLKDRQAEVKELDLVRERLLEEGKRLKNECQDIDGDFTAIEQEMYEMIEKWTTDQLETEIQSTQARLEMTSGGGNENLIREFENREKYIDELRSKLSDLEGDLEDAEAKIRDVRQKWEPELDELVGSISEAFAENFARIQCAGEVAVHKDEDFELWAIQIKVKFRENEHLSVLDSHRQSGGERAVSTIFYLMALQSLARAPFRVVDEINQGMDPRNERLVHSRMVDIACAEHTSQYFLITPKLLNGLKYHPNMKVHCIASGEYMPADHRELDFGLLAKKALALRGAGVVGAA